MVWDVIFHNTWSPLVLIRGTMTAQWYVHDILHPYALPLMLRPLGAIFRQGNARTHMARISQDIAALLLPFLGLLYPQICLQTSISGSFETASRASHELKRTRGMVAANMERNIARHHTELIYLSA
ncbi:transposable element Tcb2 transposase [Trichonephila clavipes]|nr:transposable element Tcb2 transposase [Trichonephila clavipes]